MSSKDTVLGLIADDELRRRIAALHQMKTINIDTDPEKESLIPRPETPPEVLDEVNEVLNNTEATLTGYNSEEVDFAQTVESMIRDEDIAASDSDEITDMIEGGAKLEEQLPEGEEIDESFASSNEMSPMTEEERFEEELKDLFDDDDDSEEDMILTSENLQRLNETTPDTDTMDETDAEDIDDIDEFLDDIEEDIEQDLNEEGTDDEQETLTDIESEQQATTADVADPVDADTTVLDGEADEETVEVDEKEENSEDQDSEDASKNGEEANESGDRNDEQGEKE
jgi:hypothetical protein